MSSSRSSSCFGSILLVVASLVVIRYALPGLWKVIVGVSTGAVYLGIVAFVVLLGVIGYFIVKNLRENKRKAEAKKTQRADRTEALYRNIASRLQSDLVLNEVSAEEWLQAELLIGEKLGDLKTELIRLHDFVSPANRRVLDMQMRDYQQKLKSSTDESVRQVLLENLKMLEEKKARFGAAEEEIRQKEALLDLVYNSLAKIEEDLRFSRPVSTLFPADLYIHFGLEPPGGKDRLPPMLDRSASDE